METVIITGGTGMIGTALTKALVAEQFKVIILTRDPAQGRPVTNVSYAAWDIEKMQIDERAIRSAQHIVHLAGANVAEGRWTKKRKQEIVSSRVKSGELIVQALRSIPNEVRTVISASATGFYGEDPVIPNPKPFREDGMPASDFLANVVVEWERAIAPVADMNRRLVYLRTGIVLSKEGGAYAAFRKPLNFGMSTVLGSGRQIISWIHIHDLVQLYLKSILHSNYRGAYNAVAPGPVSNQEMMKAISAGKRHLTMHVPAMALKLALGEMSTEVLKSTTVSAEKILNEGFRFKFGALKSAIDDIKH